MTIKVWKRDYIDRALTIANKGKECRIDVAIGTNSRWYDDTIKITTHSGTVKINGNHVHEMMKSIIRFSSRDMLETWIRFALLTNQAAGRKEIDLNGDRFSFEEYHVDKEKRDREREIEWNNNYFS